MPRMWRWLPILLLSSSAYAEAPKWFCVATAATGFAYKDSRWVDVTFRVDDKRYVLSPEDVGYVFKKLGNNYATAFCPKEPDGYGYLECKGVGEVVRINVRTLRYSDFYTYGFVDGDGPGNTPYVEIGSCSPI